VSVRSEESESSKVVALTRQLSKGSVTDLPGLAGAAAPPAKLVTQELSPTVVFSVADAEIPPAAELPPAVMQPAGGAPLRRSRESLKLIDQVCLARELLQHNDSQLMQNLLRKLRQDRSTREFCTAVCQTFGPDLLVDAVRSLQATHCARERRRARILSAKCTPAMKAAAADAAAAAPAVAVPVPGARAFERPLGDSPADRALAAVLAPPPSSEQIQAEARAEAQRARAACEACGAKCALLMKARGIDPAAAVAEAAATGTAMCAGPRHTGACETMCDLDEILAVANEDDEEATASATAASLGLVDCLGTDEMDVCRFSSA